MKQQDAKPEQALPHDLILEGRNKLTVTGVRRDIRCDAEGAAILTSKGTLALTGPHLLSADGSLLRLAERLQPRPRQGRSQAYRPGGHAGIHRRAYAGRLSAPSRPVMGPALSPGAVGQEMAACAVLGGVLGAARAVLPTRGRAAFLPDMLFVGAVLMALQSYAVSQSQAGQLRGYMALAAFCAAGAVQAALRPLFAAAEAFAGKLLLGPVRLAARCIAPWKAARAAAKVRRNEKRLAKKQKKSLPTPRRMLYNSNVSK